MWYYNPGKSKWAFYLFLPSLKYITWKSDYEENGSFISSHQKSQGTCLLKDGEVMQAILWNQKILCNLPKLICHKQWAKLYELTCSADTRHCPCHASSQNQSLMWLTQEGERGKPIQKSLSQDEENLLAKGVACYMHQGWKKSPCYSKPSTHKGHCQNTVESKEADSLSFGFLNTHNHSKLYHSNTACDQIQLADNKFKGNT